jgi:hypothetical protein
MADLNINVVPTKDFVFEPDGLMIRPMDQDILTGLSRVYYELTESTLNKNGYESRDWSEKGVVKIPTELLVTCRNPDGTLNETVVNQILQTWNLSIAPTTTTTTEAPVETTTTTTTEAPIETTTTTTIEP